MGATTARQNTILSTVFHDVVEVVVHNNSGDYISVGSPFASIQEIVGAAAASTNDSIGTHVHLGQQQAAASSLHPS